MFSLDAYGELGTRVKGVNEKGDEGMLNNHRRRQLLFKDTFFLDLIK